VLRRVLVVLVVLACGAGVVAYQVTRPDRAPASPKVFVPSPTFFTDFSPSFRTSIADVYYLMMVQYYGEHVKSDGRLDALPEMLDLVTTLSPHFTRAYLFGAFALVDAGRPDLGYELLKKGFEANPDDWRFPAYLGFFAYRYGEGKEKDRAASQWYQKAAAHEGSPDYLARLAAVLASKAGDDEKAILMWGQVYLAGDKYARQKAVAGLEEILPEEQEARMKALAPLYDTMPKAESDSLIAELFKDYVQ
jgi:tetratricopeptide (TPR) repeat protein